jgi:hypothetical protein
MTGISRRCFPECLEDWVDENNPVRVIDVFVDTLDLAELGFAGVDPQEDGPALVSSAVLSSFTSTAISMRCNRAVGWSARRAATSK